MVAGLFQLVVVPDGPVAVDQAQQADGQIMFILILTLAASEASVGLALLLQLYRRFQTLDIDAAGQMKG